jgi:hypothetical protein
MAKAQRARLAGLSSMAAISQNDMTTFGRLPDGFVPSATPDFQRAPPFAAAAL